MCMKDDHMRNGQLKPAYNVQIGVESEYVTGVGIFNDRNDIATLIPMFNNMQEKIGCKYLNIIADSGYESEENYLFIEANTQIPYIKPQTYEKWKKEALNRFLTREKIVLKLDLFCFVLDTTLTNCTPKFKIKELKIIFMN